MKVKSLFYITSVILATAGLFLFAYFKFTIRSDRKELQLTALASINVEDEVQNKRLKQHAKILKKYAKANNFNTSTGFLIDMRLHSGKKRFYIYNFKKDSVVQSGLVAHGSCNFAFLVNARFGNIPESGCTSLGKYVLSYRYKGRFGTAYKLKGLDITNSNAFKRSIVLHSYNCIPDYETYPAPVCNSLGCPMVSEKFILALQRRIDSEKKPVLLWIFN